MENIFSTVLDILSLSRTAVVFHVINNVKTVHFGQTQHAGSDPQPRIGNSMPLAVGAQILTHWTTKESPEFLHFL